MKTEKSENLIDYIIQHTDLSQAALARRLNVSRAQISKWKAGDHISSKREGQLLKLAGLFDTVNVEWAMFAKTEENAQAWYDYMSQILEDVEWGYILRDCFQDEPEIYVGHTIRDLCALGANIDEEAPTTRWIDQEEYESTPLASVLFSLLEAWGQMKEWIYRNLEFDDVTDNVECELFDITSDLKWWAFDLALDNVESGQLTAIGVEEAKLDEVIKNAREKIKSYLHDICRIRTKHGLPITDDYFQLLYLSPIDLAEQSWFRPGAFRGRVNEDTIKSYLPYGQRLILTHLECSAMALRELDRKLDLLVGESRVPENKIDSMQS